MTTTDLQIFLLLAVSLNKLFYFNLDYGTDGLALATLITIFTFNSVKLWFVKNKFSITPITPKTWKLFFIITILFAVFYFWDFSLPKIKIVNFSITPIINIFLKSILILITYLFLILRLKISNEFDTLLQKFYKWQSK